TDQPAAIGGVPAGRDLLDDEKAVSGRVDLEGYDCAIIELAELRGFHVQGRVRRPAAVRLRRVRKRSMVFNTATISTSSSIARF
ncbi:hypothetical protein ACC862_37790, partial [Rhizobium ruizarguesonis]